MTGTGAPASNCGTEFRGEGQSFNLNTQRDVSQSASYHEELAARREKRWKIELAA